jgi:hypothetical protein
MKTFTGSDIVTMGIAITPSAVHSRSDRRRSALCCWALAREVAAFTPAWCVNRAGPARAIGPDRLRSAGAALQDLPSSPSTCVGLKVSGLEQPRMDSD